MPKKAQTEPRDDRFETTHWSVVLAAAHRSSPDSDEALESLCRTYWYPLYAYVRRRGYSADDAKDLTQEFFARLLEKDYLQAADCERGRFRSFLLTVLKRFLSKERERAEAQKRGGGRKLLSIDFTSGEDRCRLEPSHDWTPEKVYERRWALTLLDQVLNRLGREYAEKQETQLFEHLKVYLTGSSGAPAYAQTAADLSMSESAVKVAVHRMRQRYRELL
ncbi:MAG: RNA polymerase sigma factor [Pirellulaceae bacterium]